MDDRLLELFTNYKLASERRDLHYKELDDMYSRIKEHELKNKEVDNDFDSAYNEFRNYIFNNF